ncbi:unnamed protein product [Rotaria socialis]|uniref:Uncharacterized protein n=2 Tax=Rotaria socialis TaxID=392032 RepID=A0A818S1K3_9BILA|nr:unnamed protein product [Rotaria socialis]CAF4253127.1 unnamed protein product [Rotaria socialis]CAF4350574.1 unnamed protein product [Rotaria socialis]CAF4600833.1 unnamed protein product [Rotaria socialis]
MLPFSHVLYMPLSSSSSSTTTTFVGPLPAEHFLSSSIVPLYNTTVLNNRFNFVTNSKFRYTTHRQTTFTHRFKRTRDDQHDIQEKKHPKLPTVINNNPSKLSKNAIMLLHELKPSIEYKLIAQTGPSHRPMFTMAVEFNGQVFEGIAQTKKEAKQAAAEKALQSFSELPFSLLGNVTNEVIPTNINTDSNENRCDQNPFYLLTQLKQNLKCEEIINEKISESNEFKTTILIDDQCFIGIGHDQNASKIKAAEYALEKLFGMCFHKEDLPSLDTDSLADRIAACIQEKFKLLTQHDVRLQRRKVLSGIVLLRDYNLETMKVICITTGTKCIRSSRLARNGQKLNDCHAEILARRCLMRYCYEQLKLLLVENSNESIFEKINNANRYKLKASISFHLYISTAPCGDSRIFSPEEISSERTSFLNVNQNSLRKSRGLLRRKIELSEGTIPVSAKSMYQHIQKWDETLAHEQLSTMSCSDKLCRWNFIGLQGALLSTLIDPIYYTSVIIGSLYHREHIRRALFSRIEHKVNHIPAPYGLRKPFISDISSLELRNKTRPSNYAFIWNCIDRKCEVIDSFSGLTISREPSLISKAVLFRQWINLMIKIQSETIPKNYYEAKQLAVDYQTAKMKVNQAFEHGGSGVWVKKSNELDEFDLSTSHVSQSS